jgi:hypothetical protein
MDILHLRFLIVAMPATPLGDKGINSPSATVPELPD